jgi:hypothetical protein
MVSTLMIRVIGRAAAFATGFSFGSAVAETALTARRTGPSSFATNRIASRALVVAPVALALALALAIIESAAPGSSCETSWVKSCDDWTCCPFSLTIQSPGRSPACWAGLFS